MSATNLKPFTKEEADAFAAGKKTQFRLPAGPDLIPCPVHSGCFQHEPSGNCIESGGISQFSPLGMPGATIRAGAALPFGKSGLLKLDLVEVRIEQLESITDQDLAREGGANWTQFAYAWNQRFGRDGFNWDTNPIVWVYEVRFHAQGSQL